MKLSYPNFNKSTLKRVQQVLNSGRVNYWTGNECKDFEKEFCESLLKGVVQNWEKIGNTSTEGLRESFLRREGLIRKTNKDYTLIVKKKPFDMLLDTLPWNITMVQNVFMKYRLLVEWN